MRITFAQVNILRECKELESYLLSRSWNYPHFDVWVERAIEEIAVGLKKAKIIYASTNVEGAIIYQSEKTLNRLCEIKSLRINPELRGRGLGRCLLKQVEYEEGGKYDGFVCDVRADEGQIIDFMQSCKYEKIATIPLYESTRQDAVLVKLSRGKREDFAERITSIRYGKAF